MATEETTPQPEPESEPKPKKSLARRILFRGTIALFLLGLITFLTARLWIDPAIVKTVEIAGTDAVGATVTLERVYLNIFDGEIDLTELRIDNPPGFEKPYFFDMESAAAKVQLNTVLEKEIVFPEVVLEGITMYLEPNDDGDYNHEIILANIEKYTASEQADTDSTETTVLIKRLVMRDIKIYYKTKVFISAPVHLKEKVLTDIGADGEGVTIGQVLSIVIVGALSGTAKELPRAIGKGIVSGTKAIGGVFKSAGLGIAGGFKSIFGIDEDDEDKPPTENAKEDEEK